MEVINGVKRARFESSLVRSAARAVDRLEQLDLKIEGMDDLTQLFEVIGPVLQGDAYCDFDPDGLAKPARQRR